MTTPPHDTNEGYDQLYLNFDSPLMRELRRKAYGEDIGQHSWVTVEELRSDIDRLGLSASDRVLDLGCGPGGPLTFILKASGCTGTGIDVSDLALAAARRRAATLSIDQHLTLQQGNINDRLPLPDQSFDAVLALDVILHARERLQVFREVARVLLPGGKFLFTDAGVLTGCISSDEVAARSAHGFTQFCPPGFNERMLTTAGFAVVQTEDRTTGLLTNAQGRIAARDAHRSDLEQLEGAEYLTRQQRYLESVVALAQRGVVARIMYLARAMV